MMSEFARFFYQVLIAAAVGWFVWYLVSNTAQNLEARGMHTGFGFLNVAAGFDSSFKLISNEAGVGTYGRIFFIGVLNTLYISALAIILSTVLGFFIGVMRLSSNWLVSKVALAYVEIFRNTPLLIQIIFWYIGVFSLLPRVKTALTCPVVQRFCSSIIVAFTCHGQYQVISSG